MDFPQGKSQFCKTGKLDTEKSLFKADFFFLLLFFANKTIDYCVMLVYIFASKHLTLVRDWQS